MKHLAPLLLLLALAGCHRAPVETSYVNPQPQPHRQTEQEWESEYADTANQFTVRTFQCIDEMYTLFYHPVNSGPVCKDACELYHKVDVLIDRAPIGDAEKYRLPRDTGVCAKAKKVRSK